MTDTLRTRLARTALDTADSVTVVTAGAAAGLTTYRTLTARPADIRITLALATGALAAVLTDHHAYKALAPLRRRLGAEHHSPARETAPPATPEQLAADVRTDAAQRAASGAARLDYSHGALTKAENWTGMEDGSATCAITSTARLLAVPRPTDHDGYNSRTYLLDRDGEQPVQIHTIAELAALLDAPAPATAQPTGTDDEVEDGDPWAALGQDHSIAELLPAADEDQSHEDDEDEDDVDQEAEAHAASLL
ncbi:hypothetical protein ADK60_08670 [Streptomyces sp. XY431]|uniref:hypothetical protein n=1 Tax=Streptomyces sp. XY431 TaxID=1415562 RepID=UPI0006AF647F|nr:hypothetical protein [Streptomyces sp. XY431]KOV35764.1 hypothetical protein ADK60_08670 [Streptomyces sp. XY431]